MLHQPDSTVHCRTTPSNTALLMKWDSPSTWRLSDIQCTRVHHVMTSLVNNHTLNVQSWVLTRDGLASQTICQSTQGGLAQQAGTSYTRRASCDSSCFELTFSHSQQCTHSPVAVCCVSVCVAEPRAVAPTGRDWVGIIWS